MSMGSVAPIGRVAHLTRSGQVRRTDHPLELPHAAARARIAGTIYRPGFIPGNTASTIQIGLLKAIRWAFLGAAESTRLSR